MAKQILTAQEFRELYSAKHQKQNMTASEWQDIMKKKKAPSPKGMNEIRIMLQLAKIEFVEEYKFHPDRKWRFDFAIPERMIAVEYEGIFSKKSRHTTVGGYSADVEKYNAAAKLGWKVLRYTAKNYRDLVDDLNS